MSESFSVPYATVYYRILALTPFSPTSYRRETPTSNSRIETANSERIMLARTAPYTPPYFVEASVIFLG